MDWTEAQIKDIAIAQAEAYRQDHKQRQKEAENELELTVENHGHEVEFECRIAGVTVAGIVELVGLEWDKGDKSTGQSPGWTFDDAQIIECWMCFGKGINTVDVPLTSPLAIACLEQVEKKCEDMEPPERVRQEDWE